MRSSKSYNTDQSGIYFQFKSLSLRPPNPIVDHYTFTSMKTLLVYTLPTPDTHLPFRRTVRLDICSSERFVV